MSWAAHKPQSAKWAAPAAYWGAWANALPTTHVWLAERAEKYQLTRSLFFTSQFSILSGKSDDHDVLITKFAFARSAMRHLCVLFFRVEIHVGPRIAQLSLQLKIKKARPLCNKRTQRVDRETHRGGAAGLSRMQAEHLKLSRQNVEATELLAEAAEARVTALSMFSAAWCRELWQRVVRPPSPRQRPY